MKKILLAIYDDVARAVYKQLFLEEKFTVFETKNGREAIHIAFSYKPDFAILDVRLLEVGGLEVLKLLQNDPVTYKIPVIIFSAIERETEKLQAMDFGAWDYIVGATTLPTVVVAKVKIHLGFQKTYEVVVDPRSERVVRELRRDMGYSENVFCPKCGIPMNLFLIRDLTKGKDYFKVSFSCSNCGYTE